MKYKQALQSLPSDFKRKYGVSPETFWLIVQAVRDAKQGSRGSHAKLSIPDQVVLTLEYWREYRTLFHIAQDWGIHEATAQRTVKRIEEFLIKSQKFRLPSQRELSKQSSEIKRVIIPLLSLYAEEKWKLGILRF